MIRLGFHVSIAGSIVNAPLYAAGHGFGAFQIFTTSSRTWKHTQIAESDSKEFMRLTKEGGMVPFAHIPYLCNIASPNRDVYDKSLGMLVNNLENCEALGIGCLVIHIGSHLGKGIDYGIESVTRGLEAALERTSSATVLLENSSGYRNSVGSKFEEIGRIIDNLSSDRIGMCFDTCHAFAAGYDITTRSGMASMAEELESSMDPERMRLVHLNDAKFELGSGLDRHWHIGRGNIGEGGFLNLFGSELFRDGCFIMETPDEPEGQEMANLAEAKRIIGKATGQRL